MPTKRHWTGPEDAQIRRLRAEGFAWEYIAATLHITRDATISRGRAIGATAPPRARPHDPQLDYLADPCRDPLPPGHSVPWHAITAGTLLDACPYRVDPSPPDEIP